jgi:hypothetical protein
MSGYDPIPEEACMPRCKQDASTILRPIPSRANCQNNRRVNKVHHE